MSGTQLYYFALHFLLFSMAEKYDPMAESYAEYKKSPFVRYVEKPCFLKVVGSLKGLKVLEVGSGAGFYCREFVHLGAKEVVGVEISKKMLQIANDNEAANPLGIKYLEGDARQMESLGEFDVVCAAYLFNDMVTREEILETCQGQ
jgi:2-polyprenyl-3-methyl-5-hydroxy-6-metoxy-1,4-benzoquinol methylase